MKIFIWGASIRGKNALARYGEANVAAFIDNDERKFGNNGMFLGKQVYSFQEYLSLYATEEDFILVAVQKSVFPDIKAQLQSHGIEKYALYTNETLITFCPPNVLDDVILYHALRDIENVFYIDIGANDPVEESVTKYLYAFHDAHGINIEPQPVLYEALKKDRKRDICVNACCGDAAGTATLYLQSGCSTLLPERRKKFAGKQSVIEVECVTLSEICKKYVPENQPIHLLKIDVEGYEAKVIQGGNFEVFRPWILDIESGEELAYQEWEGGLLKHGYHFVFAYGVNRYYAADEHHELDSGFPGIETLKERYRILSYWS